MFTITNVIFKFFKIISQSSTNS